MRMFTVALLWALQAAPSPDPKIREEYEALVKQLDLGAHPERHAQAAAWCLSKKWKSQADIHDIEARRFQFRKESDKIKGEPSASDLKRMLELALKLKLEIEANESRDAWLSAEIRERRARLKTEDAAGLKALVSWAAKQNAGRLAAPIAEELLKIDPAEESAHLILGHLKRGSDWIDPWPYLVSKGGIKNAAVRGAVHKEIGTLRPKRLLPFPVNPLVDAERVQRPGYAPAWKLRLRSGDGLGIAYLFVPSSYTPAKAYPLIVDLHGGGNGNFQLSEAGAYGMAQEFASFYPNTDAIVVCPTARNHVMDSWKFRENAFDVIDSVIDCCERFNIDRRRIYVTGASMGGQGTQVLSWTVPELSPAFCPQVGYYLSDKTVPPVPDLTGKHYLIFHGGKDTVVGQKTHGPFIDRLHAAGATAKLVFFPEEGHQLPHAKVIPAMLEFFKKHQLDYEPDLPLVRRMVEELLPWKDRPKEAARAPLPPAPAPDLAPASAPAVPNPAGSVIDLLSMVDPSRDAVAGSWRWDGKTLIAPAVEYARLQILVAVPEEYDLELVVQRPASEKPETLAIGLVAGVKQFMIGLDGNKGTKSGLDAIDGKRFVENETTRDGTLLSTDKSATILVKVRKDRVIVAVDGKPVVDWNADYTRVSMRPVWAARDAKSLFLGSHQCSYRITQWVLRPSGHR